MKILASFIYYFTLPFHCRLLLVDVANFPLEWSFLWPGFLEKSFDMILVRASVQEVEAYCNYIP